MFNDHFPGQYGQIGTIMYNPPNPKKISPRSAFQKQFNSNYCNKLNINGLSTIYNKQVEELHMGFTSKKSRIVFIRKVFFALFLQIIFCLICIMIALEREDVRSFTMTYSFGQWITLSLTILTLIILACCEFHRKTPYNYFSLIIFTIFTCSFFVYISAMFDNEIIKYALIVLAFTKLILILFLCQTKFNFGIYFGLGLGITACLSSFLGLLYIFKVNWSSVVYGGILGLTFTIFFIIDIQMIVGESHKSKIMENEYIFATMTLYTDIVNLFIYILQLLNSAKD